MHNATTSSPSQLALPPCCVAGVAVLRQAGIGVILDLVLNHTGESDMAGPTLSLRGLDGRYYGRGADGALINDTAKEFGALIKELGIEQLD